MLSVRVLGLDADLTPSTERTVCGFMGLTLLFRRLIRFWWYLDLDLLKRVLILTMDVPDELFAFSHDRAVLGSRLSPNILFRMTGNLIPESFSIFRFLSLT